MENSVFKSKNFITLMKILLTLAALFISYFAGIWIYIFAADMFGLSIVISSASLLILPALFLPLIWFEKRKKVLIYWLIFLAVFIIAAVANGIYRAYDNGITINQTPNINVHKYLPFEEGSKIVTLPEGSSLKLTENLPRVDGASAVFPVYSAFVNAVYPETTELYGEDNVFQYNSTDGGYSQLAHKRTDIFFGSYPSENQIRVAKANFTEFVYTPIGKEAFVFFTHKDNPVDSLTTEQLKGIYAGEITNWSQVGGENKKIAAYQRNEGSGSQSRLIRFMEGRVLMEPPTELRSGAMTGIIEKVSDYRSNPGSIGFSFRYYVEEIIQNPDIKILAVDGVYPSVETIKDETYPLTGILYAVTYEGNENENVQKLLDWILSKEGQYIIEETGYVPIK